MFLEKLENNRPLPRQYSTSDERYREQALSCWDEFVLKLRNPNSLDTDFFVILAIGKEIEFLDQVSWSASHIGGFSVLRQDYRCINQEEARTYILDFGFLDNGLLSGGDWLTASYFESIGVDVTVDEFVLPSQLDLDDDLYEHYAAIARHDEAAICRLGDFSPTETHRVPFKISSHDIEEFSPLGYAVAHNNLKYVTAAGLRNVCFSECRSFDDFGMTHLACRFGSCAMLRAVLGNGGLIDDLNGELLIPLEISVQGKDIDHVDCLLAHGANPNFGIDESKVEVEHATALAEMSLIMYTRLRNAGTRFDLHETKYLWTPLHYNAKRFHRDTFIQMVKDGLDPHAKDYKGRTPFDSLRSDVPKEIFDDVYRQCVRK
jgi:hypothetical protein